MCIRDSLCDPVKVLRRAHIGHGVFAAVVVHQLLHALAALRGQRLPVVLLQCPRYLPKSGSQHFSRELRCPDRKGNRFMQEEVNQKTVALSIRTTKLTGNCLLYTSPYTGRYEDAP